MKTLGLSIGLAVVLSAALVESADAYELDSSLPTTSELPAPGTQRRARVAGGVDEFFAVWEDTRHGVSEIYGTRIDAVTGLPRDIGGIVIATSPARAPRVTFDGKQYLVAWSTGAKVRMARVDPSAPATSAVGKTTELLFKPGQQEPAGPNETATVVGLAASGNHFTVGVVTNDTGDMLDMLDPAAKLYVAGVDPKSMAHATFLGATPAGTSAVGLALCGGQYRVVAAIKSDSVGSVLALEEWYFAADGSVPPTKKTINFPLNFPPTEPADAQMLLACATSKSVVSAYVWRADSGALYMSRDEFAGLPSQIEKAPGALVTLTPDGVAPYPKEDGPASSHGSGMLVGWSQTGAGDHQAGIRRYPTASTANNEVYEAAATRIDVAATTSATPTAVKVFESPSPEVEATDTYVARVPLVGNSEPTKGQVLSNMPNTQREVALAATSTGAFAAWTDLRYEDGHGTVTYVATDSDGKSSGTPTRLVEDEPFGTFATFEPAVAAALGSTPSWLLAAPAFPIGTIVSVNESLGLHLLRGSAEKQPKKGTLFPKTTNRMLRHPAVAVTGDKYTLVMEERASNGDVSAAPVQLLIARLPVNPADPMDIVSFAVDEKLAEYPAIASTHDADAALVWEREGKLYGATLAAAATSLEQAQPLEFNDDPGEDHRAALVFRGDRDEGLLVWQHVGNNGRRLYAMRVNSALQAAVNSHDLPPEPLLLSGELDAAAPKVVVDGATYLVAFEAAAAGGVKQIYTTRVDVALDRANWSSLTPVTVTEPIPDGSLLAAGAPALAQTANSGALLGYEQHRPSFDVPRVLAQRVVGSNDLGKACTDDHECNSIRCADNICCENACKNACERCSAPGGGCEVVLDGPDAECTLDGRIGSCSHEGKCLPADGESCDSDAACASGHCVNAPSTAEGEGTGVHKGVCCDRSCDGACDTCRSNGSALPDGVCHALECGTYSCEPEDVLLGTKVCVDRCEDTSECAPGFQCVASACVTPPVVSGMTTGCNVASNGAGGDARIALGLGLTLAVALGRRRKRAA